MTRSIRDTIRARRERCDSTRGQEHPETGLNLLSEDCFTLLFKQNKEDRPSPFFVQFKSSSVALQRSSFTVHSHLIKHNQSSQSFFDSQIAIESKLVHRSPRKEIGLPSSHERFDSLRPLEYIVRSNHRALHSCLAWKTSGVISAPNGHNASCASLICLKDKSADVVQVCRLTAQRMESR